MNTASSNLIELAHAYIALGWRLVPIPAGSKGPHVKGWNRRGHTLDAAEKLNGAAGVGLAHCYSNTCAIDIDDYLAARNLLRGYGVDLDTLISALETVRIDSGREGRFKLVFAVPSYVDTADLVSWKEKVPGTDKDAIEFRCATSSGRTVQDVLPPSVHPDTGKPYRWVGDWRNLPPLPNPLIELWLNRAHRKKTNDQAVTPNEWEKVDLSTLGLSPRTLTLIRRGPPEGKYQSRSEAIFGATKDLVKAGASDETISRVIADPENAISEGALERRRGDVGGAMAWVGSQIPKARADVALDTEESKAVTFAEPIVDSDLANAKRIVEAYGEFIRYTDEGGYFIWNGKQWIRDPKNTRVHALAKKRLEHIYDEIKTAPDQNAMFKWARQSQHAVRIPAAVDLVRSEPRILIPIRAFDSDKMVLNTPTGLVNLATGLVTPAAPAQMCSRITGTGVATEPGCERWKQFLHEIMGGDDEMVGYIRRAVGYSLTGCTGEQCLFFCYGLGANGKTVFIEILNALMGTYTTSTRIEAFTTEHRGSIPNDIAALAGARVVSVSETDEGQRLSESLVKDSTGGDTISARFLHQEFFQFEPQFKLWIRGNHKPNIHGTDDGIWRRIQLIPFEEQFGPEERDPNLRDKLMDELPGILQWAVRGCLEWQAQGLLPPKKITQAVAEYRSEMDVIGQFLSESTHRRPGLAVSAKALYQAYRAWADESGHGAVSVRRFGLAMTERGFRKERQRSGVFYLGVTLTA